MATTESFYGPSQGFSTQDGYAERWELNSTGSDESTEVNASSDLAARPQEFANWAAGVKLNPTIIPFIPESDLFKPIRDIQTASKTFPASLKDPEFLPSTFLGPAHVPLRDKLCAALQSKSSEYIFCDNDDLDLISAIRGILPVCGRHENFLSLKNTYGVGSELGAYGHINALMSLCYCDEDHLVNYITRQELKLPSPPIDVFPAATTKPDGITFILVLNFHPYISSRPLRIAASAFCTKKVPRYLGLLHCVTSYSSEVSGENRMKIGMVSALHQKKVLGLQGQFVFGIYQFMVDYLRVVAGIWQDDEVKIYEVGTYTLRAPESVVEFYLVLRGIKQLAYVYKDQLLESGESLMAEIQVNPPANEWAQMPGNGGTSMGSANQDQWDSDSDDEIEES